MEKMIVVVFENQSKAVAGLHALRELSSRGEISVYDAQVVTRELNGAVRVVDNVDLSGFPEIVGGTAVGTLVGLLGGPIGAFVGGSAGALLGAIADAREVGVTEEFVNDIEAALTPGAVERHIVGAIVGEAPAEDRTVELLGGLDVGPGQFDIVQISVCRHLAVPSLFH